jgi:hypothetical protein
MSQQAAEHATAYALKHGLEVYLKDSAQLFAATQNSSSSDANSFMAHYLTAVVCGQHLPWRHYALIAGEVSTNPSYVQLCSVTTVVWWISTVPWVDQHCAHSYSKQSGILLLSAAAGTHFNRQCFLVTAQRSLAPLAAAGRLSFGDMHSLLQLLCPDFPTSVLKNAWSSAVAVQECK